MRAKDLELMLLHDLETVLLERQNHIIPQALAITYGCSSTDVKSFWKMRQHYTDVRANLIRAAGKVSAHVTKNYLRDIEIAEEALEATVEVHDQLCAQPLGERIKHGQEMPADARRNLRIAYTQLHPGESNFISPRTPGRFTLEFPILEKLENTIGGIVEDVKEGGGLREYAAFLGCLQRVYQGAGEVGTTQLLNDALWVPAKRSNHELEVEELLLHMQDLEPYYARLTNRAEAQLVGLLIQEARDKQQLFEQVYQTSAAIQAQDARVQDAIRLFESCDEADRQELWRIVAQRPSVVPLAKSLHAGGVLYEELHELLLEPDGALANGERLLSWLEETLHIPNLRHNAIAVVRARSVLATDEHAHEILSMARTNHLAHITLNDYITYAKRDQPRHATLALLLGQATMDPARLKFLRKKASSISEPDLAFVEDHIPAAAKIEKLGRLSVVSVQPQGTARSNGSHWYERMMHDLAHKNTAEETQDLVSFAYTSLPEKSRTALRMVWRDTPELIPAFATQAAQLYANPTYNTMISSPELLDGYLRVLAGDNEDRQTKLHALLTAEHENTYRALGDFFKPEEPQPAQGLKLTPETIIQHEVQIPYERIVLVGGRYRESFPAELERSLGIPVVHVGNFRRRNATLGRTEFDFLNDGDAIVSNTTNVAHELTTMALENARKIGLDVIHCSYHNARLVEWSIRDYLASKAQIYK